MAGEQPVDAEEKQADGQEGASKLGLLLLAVLVLAAIVVAICCLTSIPREALCPQADALAQARLLDKAETTYASAEAAGEDCAEDREAVEARQTKATRRFEAAQLHAAIGTAEVKPPKAEPKLAKAEPKQVKKKAKTAKQKKAAKAQQAKAKAAAVAAAAAAAKKLQEEREGVTDQAIDEYVNGLALSPFNAPAREALTALLDKQLAAAGSEFQPTVKRCELVTRLAGFGLLEQASQVYASVPPSSEPPCETALGAVQSQRAAAGESLGEAKRQLALGDKEEAREKFAAALRADIGLVEARNGLENSLEEETCLDAFVDWLGGVPDSLKDALRWIVPLLAFLILIPLLLMLAVWFGVRELSAKSPAVRTFAERNSRLPGLSFLHKAAVPRVLVEEFESADGVTAKGKDFATMLEAAIPRQAGREPAFPFDRVGKDRAPDDDLGQFTELLDKLTSTTMLGSVIQLLSKLFRRRTIYLSGRLTRVTTQGAGVVLNLEGNGRGANASTTLWEKAFVPQPGGEDADRWLRLVPAATAWTRWHLAAAHAYPQQIGEHAWLADARFHTALSWQTAGDHPRAEALYTSTIEGDPGMLPAVHNLAVLAIRDKRYDQAVSLVALLRGRLDSTAQALWPTLELGSLYTLALARAYPNMAGQPGASMKTLEKARDLAAELVQELTLELEGEAKGKPLAAELKIAESPSVVLLASLIVECDAKLLADAAEQAATDGDWCDLNREQLAKNPGQQKPWNLIDGYVRQHGRDTPRRAQYNLACYYTRLARDSSDEIKAGCLEKAFTALEESLVGGALVGWAREDPSLEGLRQADKKRFGALIARFEIKPLGAEKEAEAEQEEPAAANEAKPKPKTKKKKKEKEKKAKKKAKAGKEKPPAQ